MKTKLMLFFVVIACYAKAQSVRVGLGAELNFPSGNSSNISAIGVGGYLKTEFTLTPKYAITATGSFTNFFGRQMFGVRSETLAYAPVKVGFKYYSSDLFYLEGQVGAAVSLNSNTKTALAWSPGFGTYFMSKKSNNRLDVGLRYEGWTCRSAAISSATSFSTFNFIGLHLGYEFGL